MVKARETGIALVIAVMAMLLASALGVALTLLSTSELAVASNFRDAAEGLYAADALLEYALGELAAIGDWSSVLDGSARSHFIDGAPDGARTLGDGTVVDLDRVLNMSNCGRAGPCDDHDMDASTLQRPWGSNNPRWRLFAYGRLRDLVAPDATDSPFYVLAMVGDDPSENDGRPFADGDAPCHGALPAGDPPSCNPGSGRLWLRGEAFGPRGTHKIAQITVARARLAVDDAAAAPPGLSVRVLTWRQVR